MIIPSVTYKFSRSFEQKFGYEATCLTKIPSSLFNSDKENAAENTISFFEYKSTKKEVNNEKDAPKGY